MYLFPYFSVIEYFTENEDFIMEILNVELLFLINVSQPYLFKKSIKFEFKRSL